MSTAEAWIIVVAIICFTVLSITAMLMIEGRVGQWQTDRNERNKRMDEDFRSQQRRR